MVLARPNQQHMKQIIKIQEGNEEIRPDKQGRILGWLSNREDVDERNIDENMQSIPSKQTNVWDAAVSWRNDKVQLQATCCDNEDQPLVSPIFLFIKISLNV